MNEIKMENLKPRIDDQLFQNSPDAGDIGCICSRCGMRIQENEMPIRVFVNKGHDGEYRYCEKCQQE